MGVAFTRVVTLRPSGAWRTISSACTVSPVLSARARGNSFKGDFPPAGPTEGHHLQQLLRRAAGRAAMTDRRPQKGLQIRRLAGVAERLDVVI